MIHISIILITIVIVAIEPTNFVSYLCSTENGSIDNDDGRVSDIMIERLNISLKGKIKKKAIPSPRPTAYFTIKTLNILLTYSFSNLNVRKIPSVSRERDGLASEKIDAKSSTGLG